MSTSEGERAKKKKKRTIKPQPNHNFHKWKMSRSDPSNTIHDLQLCRTINRTQSYIVKE